MKNSISKVERRLVKVEQKLAERARRKLLETCVCTKVSYFESVEPEKLEKEMNVPCPAHEFRSLGSRFSVLVQPNGPEPRPASLVGRPQPRVDYAFFTPIPTKPLNWAESAVGRRAVLPRTSPIRCPNWTKSLPCETPWRS